MRKRKVECPICHTSNEIIASMSHWLFAHHCSVTESWWYTNGVLWSTDMEEITGVERTRAVQSERTTSQDRQVPGKVVQAQFTDRSQDQPSPA